MTQGQWRRAPSERRSPSYYGKGWRSAAHDGGRTVDLRHPVEQISWDEARLVFDRLTIEFPTEAQWEYAARAGAGGRWADASEIAALARFSNISGLESEGHFSNLSPEHRDPFLVHAPVGSFEPNRFGLHDMIGNVYELCLDPSSYALTPPPDERGGAVTKTRAGRIGRGGSFGAKAAGSRAAFRRWIDPSFRIDYLGVRPARAIGP